MGDTWQGMMHMITLHLVPFISTTVNIAVSDIRLLREDTPQMIKAGIVYVICNICGQFYYGSPLYEFTTWVRAPIESLGYCAAFIAASTVMYYISTYLVDWWAEWLAGDDDADD